MSQKLNHEGPEAMEHFINDLTEAVAENNLARLKQIRDDLTMARGDEAAALHLLAETLCDFIEIHQQKAAT